MGVIENNAGNMFSVFMCSCLTCDAHADCVAYRISNRCAFALDETNFIVVTNREKILLSWMFCKPL